MIAKVLTVCLNVRRLKDGAPPATNIQMDALVKLTLLVELQLVYLTVSRPCSNISRFQTNPARE